MIYSSNKLKTVQDKKDAHYKFRDDVNPQRMMSNMMDKLDNNMINNQMFLNMMMNNMSLPNNYSNFLSQMQGMLYQQGYGQYDYPPHMMQMMNKQNYQMTPNLELFCKSSLTKAKLDSQQLQQNPEMIKLMQLMMSNSFNMGPGFDNEAMNNIFQNFQSQLKGHGAQEVPIEMHNFKKDYPLPRGACHVGIAYHIWYKQGNLEKDPTEPARKIKELIFTVAIHLTLATTTTAAATAATTAAAGT